MSGAAIFIAIILASAFAGIVAAERSRGLSERAVIFVPLGSIFVWLAIRQWKRSRDLKRFVDTGEMQPPEHT